MKHKQHHSNPDIQNQLLRLYGHSRRNSFPTRRRYQEAFDRFVAFLVEVFHIHKIANIAPKHLRAYVNYLLENGAELKYIKTELSAIRFWHDENPDSKYKLPDNEHLSLGRDSGPYEDKTWTPFQFEAVVAVAKEACKLDYVLALYLALYQGLRIHEIFRIDTAAARNALKKGMLTIKGKNGRVRSVPLHPALAELLQKQLAATPPGHKLLVPDDARTHQCIHNFQQFIRRKQPSREAGLPCKRVTCHGLRHTYAVNTYLALRAQGKTDYEARKLLSIWLGHNRVEITHVYLASLAHTGQATPHTLD